MERNMDYIDKMGLASKPQDCAKDKSLVKESQDGAEEKDLVAEPQGCMEGEQLIRGSEGCIKKELLINNSLVDFLGKLGSAEPTPGGGAAAALVSALGASLLIMVANHTIGKPKYADVEEFNIEARAKAEKLRISLIAGVDADAEAFKRVSAAYALPKGSSASNAESANLGEKNPAGNFAADMSESSKVERSLSEIRNEAIGQASIEAAEAPLAVMEASLTGLKLAKEMIGHSNKNLESDIHVAIQCFKSGLTSASYNVEANLSGIAKVNPEKSESFSTKLEGLLTESVEFTQN